MFTVTDTAGARLAKKLDQKQAKNDVAMRFVRKRRGWQLRLDRPATGDTAFAHEGRTVLVLDADASLLLATRTLDTKASASGSKLCLL